MATAQHSKAAEFVGLGIFDNLKSFAELEAHINKIPEEKDRGDAFEIFIEGYLATQPIMQRVQHWVVGGIPLPLRERYNLPPDATGIDGIYEMHDTTHVAYQVKYRQCPNLTYAEVAPFLGLTERFTDRVIFTNASTLSQKAKKRSRWVNRETFLELSPEALGKIEAWLKSKPLPVLRAAPDPNYQTQALAEIKATLDAHPCATAVMACGTGKTLIALWATEQAEPKTVLVLVPSLTLLSQTLREWSEQTSWGNRFSYLCVCSDKTVGLKDDALNTDKSAAGFRIDTDPNIVRQFLERQTDDIKIVFSTYHSAPVVGEGSSGLPPFDIAIFDEAHKTTGYEDSMFSYALADKNISIRKRLFLTATPRHIDIRRRNKQGDFKVQSMDDAAVYGPRAHTLSFAAAAKKGIICRYKVIISLIDKKMVSDFARKHGITLVKRDEVSARWVANLISLKQAVEKVEAKKIITFHSRVGAADEFATPGSRGIARLLNGYDVRHVNGKQSSVERGDIIRAFADAPKSILTNARCLTEGVNIPAVDMVAFIDPRQSRVDIAQAVGRAMRRPRGQTTKTVGYVVVPLFAGMDDQDSIEDAVRDEKFRVVADVLNALQEHDEELVEIIREMKERKGRGKPFDPTRLNEKVQTIGPLVKLDRLSASIAVEIVERIGVRWDERFGELLAYKEEFKNCDVPSRHPKNRQLGTWVVAQRQAKKFGQLNKRQIALLDGIGFNWKLQAEWDDMYERLVAFNEKNKHCKVPQKYKDDPELGIWVNRQRSFRNAGVFRREDRIAKLDALGFPWYVGGTSWDESFQKLLKFKREHGHFNVSASENKKLANWAKYQRHLKEHDKLKPDKIKRLDGEGFNWNDDLEKREYWEKMFKELLVYKAEKGDCDVPSKWKNSKLANWVTCLRRAMRYKPESIDLEQKRRLDEQKFVWDHHRNKRTWDEMFLLLLEYKRQHDGDCNVPGGWPDDPQLASWVSNQRSAKKAGKLTEEQIQRLTEIGFQWVLRKKIIAAA